MRLLRGLRDLLPLLLFASWPFVAFLAANRGQIFRIEDVLIPWVGTLAGAVGATLFAARLAESVPLVRLSIVAGVLSAAFFSFGSLAHLLGLAGVTLGTTWLLAWVVVFAGAGWLAWVLSKHARAHLVATVGALAMVAWPALELAPSFLPGGERPAAESTAATGGTGAGPPRAGGVARNVYWFLLDGYVRDDSLSRYFAHDNEPFLQFLHDRGFRIARASYANYDNTTFSLGATLTMDYTYLPGEPRPDPRGTTRVLSGFNPTVRKFRALGYRYLHAPYAGAAKTQCGGLEDRCIRARPSGRIPLNEVQVNLLRLTPLYRVARRLLPEAFRYDHVFIEDVIDALKAERGGPVFLFAHFLSPHAPPRFDPDCEPLAGVAPTIDVGEGVYDPEQFRTDVACTNRSIMRAVNEILRTDASDPIIILQGDHGFAFRLPGEEDAAFDVEADRTLRVRRLAILNAVRLPEACREPFHDGISPVNTFRLVFACLVGTPPLFIPDRHFIRRTGSDERGLMEVELDGDTVRRVLGKRGAEELPEGRGPP